MFLLRKKFWLTIGKLLFLAFVTALALVQLPELRYDLGTKTPLEVTGPEQLADLRGRGSTFVSIRGKGDFDKAFIHDSYGVDFTYFLLEPYGDVLVVRSSEKVTDEWKRIDHWVGRLRPYRRMPFSRSIRTIYKDRFGAEISDGAFFLARDDVPRPGAWQIGATVFAVILWLVLFYVFFLLPRRRRRPAGGAADHVPM